MQDFKASILKLIIETSTNLPSDVRVAVTKARLAEELGNRSSLALDTIAENIVMAQQDESPICQDTGMPTFHIHVPVGANQIVMKKEIKEAIAEATKLGKLRSNSVDSLTGENSGNNLGPGMPVIHFDQWERDDIEVKLILKGGGCENKNIQYSLPTELEGLGKAGRDLDGIRKCILHAVYQAQGQGCSAGFIGVGIGGDRTSGYTLAKEQLFRRVDDVNPIADLAKLEDYIMETANHLEIGTMGFGGKVSLLGCKIGVMNRLPASFYVSVAYNCWAYRRLGVILDSNTGTIKEWQYKEEVAQMDTTKREAAASEEGGTRTFVLQAPISEEQIRELRVGDVVILNGEMHTGRDAFHKHMIEPEHTSPVDLNGGVIYHCGPVMLQDDSGEWHVKAAGPTTSSREEPYQADIIKKFGLRVVIGKGGMGPKTLKGLQEHGAVYLNAIGGAAQYYARCVKKVKGVDLMEFGVPEAMWHLDVEGFAAIVTMDSHGGSLHAEVDQTSLAKLSDFAAKVF
ncbi:MAG: fumarate hydratase [Tumebacillaceae bacterium]